MSVVVMTLPNPLILAGLPITFRMFLLCRMNRVTIMSIQRTLSATETEKCSKPKLYTVVVFPTTLYGNEVVGGHGAHHCAGGVG